MRFILGDLQERKQVLTLEKGQHLTSDPVSVKGRAAAEIAIDLPHADLVDKSLRIEMRIEIFLNREWQVLASAVAEGGGLPPTLQVTCVLSGTAEMRTVVKPLSRGVSFGLTQSVAEVNP